MEHRERELAAGRRQRAAERQTVEDRKQKVTRH
jgi:hypothetical protein